jgi:hypothetical protein
MPIPLGSRPDDRCSSSRSANSSPGRTLIRKTSLLRIVPTACGQAADIATRRDPATRRFSSPHSATTLDARRLRSVRDVAVTIATRSDPSSSRCQISRTRTDSLWALNTGAEFCFSANEHPGWWSQTGSNRRPPACKAGALPTELWPRQRTEDG